MSMGGGAAAPQPPKFKQINIGQIQRQAINADIAGYDWSDTDLATRFPGLVAARPQFIQQAYDQLTGPLDPTVQNAFVNQGAQGALGSFGSGNPLATINPSGASGNALARSVAVQTQSKQDQDRANFEQVVQQNLPRKFGLTGPEVGQLFVDNAASKIGYQQALYQGQVGAYNANQAASGQLLSTGIGAGATIIGAIIAI